MDVLILGNGFDLAHGLKTRYKDFLDYYFQKEKAKNFDGGFIDSEKLKKSKNVWLYHFVNKQNQLGDKWIDLEEEIYNVIKKIDEDIKQRGIQLNDYTGTTSRDFLGIKELYLLQKLGKSSFDLSKIFDDLESFYYDITQTKLSKEEKQKIYKQLIPFLYEQLRTFTNEFNNYLSKEVLKNIGIKKYKLNLSKVENIRVLNFNYTNTFEKLYGLGFAAVVKPKYVYIHGKVCNLKDSNLILGTKSFYNKKIKDLNDEEEINVEFNIFKKHNQRHRYATIEDYQNLLILLGNLPVNGTLTFHVVGHSLAESDHNILKHIFKVRKYYKINIYYHNQEALERLINNITEIIGEEEVMAKVSFIYQEDINRGFLIPD